MEGIIKGPIRFSGTEWGANEVKLSPPKKKKEKNLPAAKK